MPELWKDFHEPWACVFFHNFFIHLTSYARGPFLERERKVMKDVAGDRETPRNLRKDLEEPSPAKLKGNQRKLAEAKSRMAHRDKNPKPQWARYKPRGFTLARCTGRAQTCRLTRWSGRSAALPLSCYENYPDSVQREQEIFTGLLTPYADYSFARECWHRLFL